MRESINRQVKEVKVISHNNKGKLIKNTQNAA